MTQATTTSTLRLVEAFRDNERDGEHPEVFHDGTSNRVYETLDGHTTVVTSWTDQDENYDANVVPWVAANEHGEPGVEFYVAHLFNSAEAPHADGPDTDETHEAALAQIGFTVYREEDEA